MAEPADFEDLRSEFAIAFHTGLPLVNFPGTRNVATQLMTLRSPFDRILAPTASGVIFPTRGRVAAFGTPPQAPANGNGRCREYDE